MCMMRDLSIRPDSRRGRDVSAPARDASCAVTPAGARTTHGIRRLGRRRKRIANQGARRRARQHPAPRTAPHRGPVDRCGRSQLWVRFYPGSGYQSVGTGLLAHCAPSGSPLARLWRLHCRDDCRRVPAHCPSVRWRHHLQGREQTRPANPQQRRAQRTRGQAARFRRPDSMGMWFARIERF